MPNSQRLTPILRRDVSRVEPAKARDQRSRDRGDRRPFAQIARLLSSAEEAHYAQTKRYRARQHASNSHHSATSALPQWVETSQPVSFDAQFLHAFENRRSKSQPLQRPALAMPHEFEHSDRRRQSRHAKMDWQFVDTLIPHRDRRRADQHARVIGKRKTERQRNCLSSILDNAQWKRCPVTVLHELRKGGR